MKFPQKPFSELFPRDLLAVLALAILTFLVFGQSLRFGYIQFDDDVFVEKNPPLTKGLSAEGIEWAFTANFFRLTSGAEYWEPLTLLTRLADYQFYGSKPEGHHRTSVIIHLAAGLALFGLLKTLTARFWESFIVAALFLIHPMHVEPVCWLSARKDLVSGLFYILALWAYAIYGKKPGIARYSLLFLAFILANMAKPMAVSLPFVFCFLDFWPLRRWKPKATDSQCPVWKLLLEKLPFLVIAVLVSSMAYFTQKGIGAVQDTDLLSLPWRLGNALLATGTYLCKAFVPINLAILYPHPGRNLNIPLTALSGVMLVALSFLIYRCRKHRPWLIVGFLWFIFVLGPVIGIIQIGDQAMADRYSYLSFIGLFIAVVWELSSRFGSAKTSQGTPPIAPNRPAWMASLGVIGIFAYVAFLQTQTWKNSITAFGHALEVTENNYIMHFNLGGELLKIGDQKAGLAHLQKAVFIRAPVIDYLLKKSDQEALAGQYPAAIKRIEKVLRLMPWNSDLHMKLGKLYHQNGQRNLGQRQYALAFHYRPELVVPRLELAKSFADEGKTTNALIFLNQALALEPANVDLLALKKKLLETPEVH